MKKSYPNAWARTAAKKKRIKKQRNKRIVSNINKLEEEIKRLEYSFERTSVSISV